jgi:hypothetical protein
MLSTSQDRGAPGKRKGEQFQCMLEDLMREEVSAQVVNVLLNFPQPQQHSSTAAHNSSTARISTAGVIGRIPKRDICMRKG